MAVVSTDRRDTLSYRKKMECSEGSGISSRVYNGREDGVMGSLAARRVAEGDWAGVWEAVIVDLFPGLTARWNSSIPSASLAVGADALGSPSRASGPAAQPSILPIDVPQCLSISPRVPRASAPTASDAEGMDEFHRAVRPGNKSTMTAYQTPAQSPSATRRAASDPITPSSRPL